MATRFPLGGWSRPFVDCCRPSNRGHSHPVTFSPRAKTSSATLTAPNDASSRDGKVQGSDSRLGIHLYFAQPSQIPWLQPNLIESYESILSPSELAKIRPEGGWHAWSSPATESEAALLERRREGLLSKVLTRCSLARSLPLSPYYIASQGTHDPPYSPQSLQLALGRYGKPVLMQASSTAPLHSTALLQHNSSHTSGLVGCAISSTRPIGLDIELIHRKSQSSPATPTSRATSPFDSGSSWLKTAKRRLSPSEYEALKALPSEEERSLMFMRLWTLKEAFVKCLGVGINARPGLASFSIAIGTQPLSGEVLQRVGLGWWKQGTANSDPDPVVEISLQLSNEFLDHYKGKTTSDHFRFLLLQPTPDHIAAVCYSNEELAAAVGEYDQPIHGRDYPAIHFEHCIPLLQAEEKEGALGAANLPRLMAYPLSSRLFAASVPT